MFAGVLMETRGAGLDCKNQMKSLCLPEKLVVGVNYDGALQLLLYLRDLDEQIDEK